MKAFAVAFAAFQNSFAWLFLGLLLMVPSEGKAEPIAVTIRKSAEYAEEVPASVIVWSDEKIDTLALNQPTSLADDSPGFSFNDPFGRFNPAPSIRGLVQPGLGDDPSVGFFSDGQYISGRSSIDTMSIDLKRLEVVKGPQSALYGRNSFGGAINAISAMPTSTWENSALARYAPDEGRTLQGVVSGPMSDTVSARVALYEDVKDAFVSNSLRGGPDMGAESTHAARLIVRATPKATRELLFRVNYVHDRDSQPAGFLVAPNCGPRTSDGALRLYCGALPVKSASYASNYVANEDDQGFTRNHVRANVEWNEDLSPGFSWHTLVGFAGEESLFIRDDDYSPVQAARAGVETKRHDGQFDSRLNIKPEGWRGSGLAGVSGYFYDNKSQRSDQYYLLGQTSPSGPTQTNTTNSLSAYARYDQPFLESWTLGGEGRLQYEQKTMQSTILGLDGNPLDMSGDWASFTPKGVLSYQPVKGRLLWYASIANGYKSGGFNDRANIYATERAFKPETNWTYETGLKNIQLMSRLFFDVTLFWIDWRDQQVLAYSTAGNTNNYFLNNAGQTRVRGLELAGHYEVTPRFGVSGTYALTDARYVRYNDPDLQNIDGFGPTGSVDGKRLPRYVPQQLFLEAHYRAPLSQTPYDWYAGSDYSLASSQFTDNSNTSRTGSRSLWGVRTGFAHGDAYFGLFAKNLLDERNPNVAIPWSDAANGFKRAWLVVPERGRFIGVELKFAF